jgi:hypothetical protein
MHLCICCLGVIIKIIEESSYSIYAWEFLEMKARVLLREVDPVGARISRRKKMII